MKKLDHTIKALGESQIFMRDAFDEVVRLSATDSRQEVSVSKHIFESFEQWLLEGTLRIARDFFLYGVDIPDDGVGKAYKFKTHDTNHALTVITMLDEEKTETSKVNAKVKLPLEIFNKQEIDVTKAWKEIERICS